MAALLARTAEGDRDAFRELYALSSRRLYGTVLYMMRERESAQEVVQEAYVTIWRRASAYDARRGDPLAWMNAIARNRAVDRLRAERARGFVSYTDTVPEIADGDADSGLRSIEALALRRALVRLKPDFRRALVLTYFNGYTHTELAAVLGVPVGTAKTWVRRGLIALRESMGESVQEDLS
ncbi:MAG: sigma-70 family RNA polymerase sigma factor [Pseudomonadota bacterium]